MFYSVLVFCLFSLQALAAAAAKGHAEIVTMLLQTKGIDVNQGVCIIYLIYVMPIIYSISLTLGYLFFTPYITIYHS